MRPRSARPLLLLALSSAAACAAPRLRTAPPPPAPRAADATDRGALPVGTFVSEELRFALRPTHGWRVLTPEESHEGNRDAVIAAAGRHRLEGCFASIFVDPAHGSELDEAANEGFTTSRVEARRVLSRERVRFANTDAVRTELEGSLEGAPIQAVRMLFLHQGYIYALVVTGTHVDAAAASEFFDAFALLPGAVTPAWAYPETSEAAGPGWRIRAGRFESANFGYAIAPGARWRFVPPARLPALDSSAEVGLVSRDPQVHVLLTPWRVPPARQATYLESLARQNAPAPGEPADAVTVRWAGEPRTLSRSSRDGVDTLRGAWCAEEVCTSVLAWGAREDRDRVERLLSDAPPVVTPLGEPERAEIDAALRDPWGAPRSTGLDYSLRGGRYVHYERGVTLRLPPGQAWRVRAGADARGVHAQLSLVFEAPRLGLAGVLMIEPLPAGGSNATYHQQVRAACGLPSPRGLAPTAVRLGRVDGLWSEGDVPRGLRYRVATGVRGDQAFRLVVGAYPEQLATAHDVLDALVAGLEVSGGPLSPRGREGDRWVDRQFGFALRVAPDATQVDQTPYVQRGSQRLDHWRVGNHEVVVAAFSSGNPTVTVTNRILEDIRRRLVEMSAVPTEWQATTVGGRPARRLSSRGPVDQTQVYMLDAGGMLYQLTISGPSGPEGDAIAQGFELLE